MAAASNPSYAQERVSTCSRESTVVSHADSQELQTPHCPRGRPSGNLHLEEQLGLVSRQADPATPSRKRPAEPSLREWQTQAQALLGSAGKLQSVLC